MPRHLMFITATPTVDSLKHLLAQNRWQPAMAAWVHLLTKVRISSYAMPESAMPETGFRIWQLFSAMGHRLRLVIILRDYVIQGSIVSSQPPPLPLGPGTNLELLVVLCFCHAKSILGHESRWNRSLACKLLWGMWLVKPHRVSAYVISWPFFVKNHEFRFSSKMLHFAILFVFRPKWICWVPVDCCCQVIIAGWGTWFNIDRICWHAGMKYMSNVLSEGHVCAAVCVWSVVWRDAVLPGRWQILAGGW